MAMCFFQLEQINTMKSKPRVHEPVFISAAIFNLFKNIFIYQGNIYISYSTPLRKDLSCVSVLK